MKIKTMLLLALLVCVLNTGCGNNEHLIQERDELLKEIDYLKTEKAELQKIVTAEKIEKGAAIYVVTINISQSHMFWEIDEKIKDSMNDIDVQIPVSEEFFNSVEVGDVLDDSFRMGSFVMNGSVGSWDITVSKKEIQ